MANRRMIHRNVSVCEQLADCSLLARLLYTWGLPHTSDWGVLAASPRRLKAQVFPIASETPEQIGAAADELVSAGLWVRFHDGDSDYICYPTFDKYQDIHKRTGKPRDGLPLPPTCSDFREVPGSYGKLPGKGSEENLSEEKEEHPLAPPGADLAAQKKLKDAERLRKQTEELDAILASLPEIDRNLLDSMIAGQQQSDKRKGKPLTLQMQKSQAEIYAKELQEHGPECWRDCCRIAIEKGVFAAEYARGCVANWGTKPTRASPVATNAPVPADVFALLEAEQEREEAKVG